MIVLIVAPGLSIESCEIAQLIQKISWQPDSPPRLVSSIQFHPEEQNKFVTDLSIAEQCRLAIQETINLTESQSDSDEIDHNVKFICRTIIIADRFDEADLVALAAWNKVCFKEFSAKSLVILGTEGRLENDIFCYCLAQSYVKSSIFEEDVKVVDIVAPCRLEGSDCLVTLQGFTKPGSVEPELLNRAMAGWSLSDLTQIDSESNFPSLILCRGFSLMFPRPISLTTGLYSARLNTYWFALVKITGSDSAELLIAPRVFSKLFSKIAKSKEKPVNIVRPVTPPIPPNHLLKLRTTNSFTDQTISLAGWTASQDQPSPRVSERNTTGVSIEALKEENKTILKKLLLLSLRHVGVDKSHPEFMSIWKHLYCGCLFALRRDLTHDRIPQSTMLSVIKNNMNFLNVSR